MAGYRRDYRPPAASDTEAQRALRWSALLEWAAAIVPPVTVVTALGVWYGYELALARGRYFGLDTTVLDYSTREYVVRSVVAVLGPMLILLVVAAVLLWSHLLVRWVLLRGAEDARWQARWQAPARAVGVVLVGLGVILTVEGLRAVASAEVLDGSPVLRCLLVGAGVLAVSYGAWLVQQSLRRPAATSNASRLWQQAGYGVTAAAVVVSVFWAFSVAAEQRGARDSKALYKHGFDRLPGVVVFATSPLALDGQGVCGAAVADPGSEYRWRYAGLRLLVRSDSRYFLLPAQWQPHVSTAIVLDEGPGLRFEFQDPGTPDLCADPGGTETSQP